MITFEILFTHYKELMLKDGFPINPRCYYGGTFNSVRTYGRCWNKVKITINAKLPIKVSPETIVHELIHTIKECNGHDSKFQYYARKASRMYGMDIGTYANETEKEAFRKVIKPKYVITCSKCGKVIATRHRECKLTKHPEIYHSGCCKAKLNVSRETL